MRKIKKKMNVEKSSRKNMITAEQIFQKMKELHVDMCSKIESANIATKLWQDKLD